MSAPELLSDAQKELRQHLSPLAPHGQGQRRQGGITVTRLAPDQFQVGHPTLGRYRLFLDDLQEVERTGPGQATLEEDAWEVTWPPNSQDPLRLYVHRQMFLPGSASYTLSAIRLERDAQVYPPGACLVCGSTRLKVRLPLYFEVEMVAEGHATWDGTGAFASHLSLAECANCKTEHPVNGWLNFQGSINGCRFGDRKDPKNSPDPKHRMTLTNLLAAVPGIETP